MVQFIFIVLGSSELLMHIDQDFQAFPVDFESISKSPTLTLDHSLGNQNHIVLNLALVTVNLT